VPDQEVNRPSASAAREKKAKKPSHGIAIPVTVVLLLLVYIGVNYLAASWVAIERRREVQARFAQALDQAAAFQLPRGSAERSVPCRAQDVHRVVLLPAEGEPAVFFVQNPLPSTQAQTTRDRMLAITSPQQWLLAKKISDGGEPHHVPGLNVLIVADRRRSAGAVEDVIGACWKLGIAELLVAVAPPEPSPTDGPTVWAMKLPVKGPAVPPWPTILNPGPQ